MTDFTTSALPADVRTLPQLFTWRVASTPDAEAYRQFDNTAQVWVSTSWAQAAERVAHWTRALAALQLPRGARIAILLPNGLDAVCIDQAAMALTCVPVPLHALDNPLSIAYIVADCDASVLIAASEAQWQAIASVGTAFPALQQVVVVQEQLLTPPTQGLPRVMPLAEGSTAPATAAPAPVTEDELATLVYTSGTTGKPKGVMLSHRNVVANVDAVLDRVAPQVSDVFLSFLPLSHTFERTGGYYLPVASGSCVAFARSVALLADDLKTVRPTVLISVPRIYERVYAKLQEMLAASPAKARLFSWAVAVGWRRFCRQQNLPRDSWGLAALDALAWQVLRRLIATPMLNQFGGRLRIAVSGGAPLSHAIARCFLGLGLPVLQGYGMTETSPVVAVNAPDDNDPSTVGRVLKGVEVRIGDNRELQVRGPSVMRGYWKREQDTEMAFLDGWLRTGDQAGIEDGRVRILGRVKEIIVTSTGEKIAPADLELAILSDALFEQVYAFGDNRSFIACVVVLNRAEWSRLAGTLQLDASAAASLEAQSAKAAVLERIRALTSSFPFYAQPRAVCLTLEPWTPENTLLTPTLKIKRNNLAVHFAAQIEALYKR